MSDEPLTTKHLIVNQAEIDLVTAVLNSADLSGNSAAVHTYEQALRGFFGTEHAVACASGTAAIHLALLSLGIGAGHQVIVPATAPAMTALGVIAAGAQPVFADVAADPATSPAFALDLADVQAKTTSGSRAVVSVPMWGYPADGEGLAAFCAEMGLALVEDAAQAHGTVTEGRLAGTRGVIGTFSTHARKLVSTGEGGFCLTNDAAIAGRLRQARNLGQPVAGGPFGSTMGLNYKLAAVLAALGTAQIARLPERLARRREILVRLQSAFSGHHGVRPLPIAPDGVPNGYAFLVHAEAGIASDLAAVLLEAGIASDTTIYGYAPIYTAPALARFAQGPCPNAEALCHQVLALPCHEAVVEDHVGHMIQALERVA